MDPLDVLISSLQTAVADVNAISDHGEGDIIAALASVKRSLNIALDAAIEAAMADAALTGSSVRSIATSAGVAPNSVRPALARSKALSGYAHDGVVGATGLALARHDAATPLRFTPRRKGHAHD